MVAEAVLDTTAVAQEQRTTHMSERLVVQTECSPVAMLVAQVVVAVDTAAALQVPAAAETTQDPVVTQDRTWFLQHGLVHMLLHQQGLLFSHMD